MADEFLELFFVGDRLPHLFPEFHHFIDDLCLETGFPAHPSGIIHNDNRYNSGNGEFKAAAAVASAQTVAEWELGMPPLPTKRSGSKLLVIQV